MQYDGATNCGNVGVECSGLRVVVPVDGTVHVGGIALLEDTCHWRCQKHQALHHACGSNVSSQLLVSAMLPTMMLMESTK